MKAAIAGCGLASRVARAVPYFRSCPISNRTSPRIGLALAGLIVEAGVTARYCASPIGSAIPGLSASAISYRAALGIGHTSARLNVIAAIATDRLTGTVARSSPLLTATTVRNCTGFTIAKTLRGFDMIT